MTSKYKDLFYFTLDHTAIHVHQWAGEILAQAKLCKNIKELENCHRKILVVGLYDVTKNFELFKKLAKNNFLIISHVSENSTEIENLFKNIPESREFYYLLGGRNTAVKHINMETFYFLTQTDANVMRAKYYTTSRIFQKTTKPYKFLYLNGADHEHRNLLWKKLESRGLLAQSLCSYLGYVGISQGPSKECDIPFKKLPEQYDSPYAINVERPKPVVNRTTYAQFKQGSWQGLWVDGDIIPNQYIDTYFSVVTETSGGKIFVTEKTYKPILAGHPFIILGAPGLYKHLQDMGFQTFEPWIDESFDEVTTLPRKIEMITKQIEKLCRGDLNKFLQEVRPICQHNQKFYLDNRSQLFYKKHIELSKFIQDSIEDAEKYFVARGI